MGDVSWTALLIRRWENHEEKTPIQVEWDNGVNAGLVDLGIRAINLQQEGERFALGIRAALQKVERKFGDGYVSSVLVTLLDDSQLCKEGEIAEVRKFIHINLPERSKTYNRCREEIADEIGGRAVELRHKLTYKLGEAKAVMRKALAIFLDERFSVSSRRNFGLL
jgi:hypothetical protein